MGCESGCYEINVDGCGSVLIPTSLAPLTSYQVKLIRPGSSVIFEREVLSDAQGGLLLTGYPVGLFNRGEQFKMTVASQTGDSVQMLFGSDVYSCALLKVGEIL